MTRRLSILLFSSWLAVPGLALGGELTPEQIAKIQREEKAAEAKVQAAHGNKKSSELSADERRQMIREQQKASQEVMDKNGVSPKDYARQTARMGPKGNAEVAAAKKALEAKEQAAKGGPGAPREPGDGEIPIQQGISEDNPVMLEEQEGAPPMVEEGLPAGEEGPSDDASAAAPAESAPSPTRSKPGRSSRSRRR
jgi:hypothetical protein